MSKEMETGKMGARALARRAKEASFALAALPGDVRRRALKAVAKALKDREQEIKAANERDLEAAVRHTVKTGRDELGADAASLFDRLDQLLFYLFFSHGRILSMGSANSKAA